MDPSKQHSHLTSISQKATWTCHLCIPWEARTLGNHIEHCLGLSPHGRGVLHVILSAPSTTSSTGAKRKPVNVEEGLEKHAEDRNKRQWSSKLTGSFNFTPWPYSTHLHPAVSDPCVQVIADKTLHGETQLLDKPFFIPIHTELTIQQRI